MKNDTLHFNCVYKIHIICVTVYQYVMNFINPDKAPNHLFGIVGKKELHFSEINRQKKLALLQLVN